MDDLDLDAFIATIEQTAPEEATTLRCQECEAPLEQVEGNYVCPACSAQATNFMQLEETELHYDEEGRAALGQRVQLFSKKNKHVVDYGWAWSTDDAVVHILALQITALEKADLLPAQFRKVISDMWLKFWLENVAPFIKDVYDERELTPIKASKALKLRDVEVLVKVKDKVMIPSRLVNRQNVHPRNYKMFGAKFYSNPSLSNLSVGKKANIRHDNEFIKKESVEHEALDVEAINTQSSQESKIILSPIHNDNKGDDEDENGADLSRNLSSDSISILTLNRTLAFIEATARCMKYNDPLFAADIIRACNQRLIPFYAASKTLPDGMKLNPRDKMMFQKIRPPTPYQLTRTASLLIHKVYHDQLPVLIPVPNLDSILERFIKDMNLPNDLFCTIKNKVNFRNFKQTCPMEFSSKPNKRRLPQYDRFAFAVLLSQLKRLFNLTNQSVHKQSESVKAQSSQNGRRLFVLEDWLKQMSIRLKLILSYDPYVLFHPLANLRDLELTSQVCKYVQILLEDRTSSSTRTHPNLMRRDETFRSELANFLSLEIPKAPHLRNDLADEDLEISPDIKHPISDALRRTHRFWIDEINKDSVARELIFIDFSQDQITFLEEAESWCIYDDPQVSASKFRISSKWPESYRLLLSVGAFLCFCEPKDLMHEVSIVEEFFQPHATVIKKQQRLLRARRGR